MSHCFVRVIFKEHLYFLSTLNWDSSAFSSLLSFILCFHCSLFFPVTSHLFLHFSQLKIAIMDISNQVSFDFLSLCLLTFVSNPFTRALHASPLYLLLIAQSSLSSFVIMFYMQSISKLFWVGCVGDLLQLSSRWCYSFIVSMGELNHYTQVNLRLIFLIYFFIILEIRQEVKHLKSVFSQPLVSVNLVGRAL